MWKIVSGSISLLLLVLNVYCNPSRIRQTANGPVEGTEKASSLGQRYYAFKGIPYAEAPISGRDPYTGAEVDRRFKAPEPLKRNWTENLKVYEYGDPCIPSTPLFQMKANSSEDCLFLNIFVPAGGVEKKTVLVWIHGGGFLGGQANDVAYGPDFLLSEDNIVVTIQYRLGIFGFLNLGFGEYTGNMGLKDQQLALKWIHQNIEHFSGKSDEILLFGHSAGGVSVNFHMLNEESRNYFNRAYLMSGSVFSYYAISKANHLERMQEYSQIYDKQQLIEYLKTADSNNVLANCHTLNKFEKTMVSPWGPTIENPGTIGAFLTKTPDEIYTSNDAPIMDTLFSLTSQEYVSFHADALTYTEPLLKENVKESKLQLPFDDLNENTHPDEYEQSLKKLREAYFSDADDKNAIKRGNIGLLSELNFGDSVLKAAELQINANNRDANETLHKNTFLFRFSVNADLNLIKIENQLEYDGAAHGDDLCYIFYCHVLDKFKSYENILDRNMTRSDISYDIIRRMVKLITNFARTGNPSIEGDTPFELCKPPTDIFCQEISNDSKSSVTNDIKRQLHYDTWRELEESYKKLMNVPHEEFQESGNAL